LDLDHFAPSSSNAPPSATEEIDVIRGERDYCDDRHPLFGQWSTLTTFRKWLELMRDVRDIARYNGS
jgi:hypothetical protein